MRAAVYDQYGPPDVVEIRDVPKPTPDRGEVLVRVRAASVAAGDWRMRRPSPFLARLFNGLLRPKRVRVLGFELSGEVEAVGDGVSRFKVGDAVVAFTGFGAHAEYRCLRESGDLDQIVALIEAGKLRPVIDRRFSLDEIARAHEYVEAGHKKGNVVIAMPENASAKEPRPDAPSHALDAERRVRGEGPSRR